jgi:hypothetical protein
MPSTGIGIHARAALLLSREIHHRALQPCHLSCGVYRRLKSGE